MTRRSLFLTALVSLVAFAAMLGGLLALGAADTSKVHVRRPAFGGTRVAGAATEFAGKKCTITFTDATGNHAWSRAANWMPARHPGASDTACIPAGKTVEIDVDVTIKSFINHGNLIINGGNVNVSGNSESG